MSDFKPSPHQTGQSVTFGDSSSDTHEITGTTTHHGSLNVENGTVSSSAGFKSSKAYQAPARDLASIDSTADGIWGTNYDYTGSLITSRSGQCLYTIGVALSASYPGSEGITGFKTTSALFTERSNIIINAIDGTYGAANGGNLSPTALLFETPYFVTYGGDTYWCLFKFVNNTGGTIAAYKTFKLNFTII